MTFSQLHENIDCDCVRNSRENTEDSFARKVTKIKKAKEADFKTHHERGKQPADGSCESICSCRGLSIDIWNTETKDKIFDKLNKSYDISPGLKKVLLVVKLKKNAGHVAPTPTADNPFHYDLYKADSFKVESHIELIEIIKPTAMQ
jgi:hypothetical protein